MLEPYRVLDLTDVRGQIAGFMLGDLGADVIRVEPPGGSPARSVGPFDGETSLSFAAYNQNKRSVVIDLAGDPGQAAFLDLVRTADFVIDSGPPSVLDDAGLTHEQLLEANPLLVQVRVTPFGSDGPMADAPAADLTVASLGGPVALQGHRERPPVRISVPQVWRHAGAEAAVAAMLGHARMRSTGAGAFIDVSAQAAMVWTTLQAAEAFAIQGSDFERAGAELQIGPLPIDMAHETSDGYVIAVAIGPMFRSLESWMIEEGVIDESFGAREDWDTYGQRLFGGVELDISLDELTETFRRFFAKVPKNELFERARLAGVTVAPVQTMDDLLHFRQLVEREYFDEIELPGGRLAHAPGPFARSTGFDRRVRTPAPSIGEHTEEVLGAPAATNRAAIANVQVREGLPFEGLKVADFSWVGVGPISAKALADHGANVIRIESQSRGDVLRAAGPYKDNVPGWNRSHFFGEFNTSKRSLALSLKHERSGEVLPEILKWADVIVDSFTPGAIERIGAGYETVKALNPSAIMVSTCLLGQTGPLATLAGYGYHASALAGFTALTGDPDLPPAGPWNAYTDTVAPRFLTTTLLAALDHRRRTGEGQHIDLGQMEAALHFLAPELLSTQLTGEVYDRNGSRARDAAPQGVYPCVGDDQWCSIAVDSDDDWSCLRDVLGNPAWAMDSTLDTVDGRLAAHGDIDTHLAEWTSAHEPRALMQLLLDAGVPAGHVQRSSDLLVDPQLAHRGFHHTLDHDEMGSIPYAGHQYRISGYAHGPRRAAPLIGAESFDILTEDIGLDPELVIDLMGSGALE